MTTTPKPGRPRLHFDTHRIRELAAVGLTLEMIADRIGCSRRLLLQRASEDAEVRGALDQGLAEGAEKIAKALFQAAEGGSVSAQIAWLRCRAGWVAKPATVPIAVVPSASPEVAGIRDRIQAMAERQRALACTDWGEDDE